MQHFHDYLDTCDVKHTCNGQVLNKYYDDTQFTTLPK
jgi:hypothetical protein